MAVGLLTWVALGLLVTRHEGHGGLHENFCGHSRRHPGVDFYQGQSRLCPWPHSQEHLAWAHSRSRAWRICPMAIAMATAMTASPTEDVDVTMSTAYALGPQCRSLQLHFSSTSLSLRSPGPLTLLSTPDFTQFCLGWAPGRCLPQPHAPCPGTSFLPLSGAQWEGPVLSARWWVLGGTIASLCESRWEDKHVLWVTHGSH